MTIEEIMKIFEEEFGSLVQHFEVVELTGDDVTESRDPRVYRPGVYVFLDEDKVVKVGKHKKNCRKRALEHFTDNTGHKINKGMKQLEGKPSLHLLLFTIFDNEKQHWVLALEDFFESILHPEIPSARRG